MTRKDYIRIAAALKAARNQFHPDDFQKVYAGWYSTVTFLADALAQDNPKFDRTRFVAACGVTLSEYAS